jgi:dienelactone hydrolase
MQKTPSRQTTPAKPWWLMPALLGLLAGCSTPPTPQAVAAPAAAAAPAGEIKGSAVIHTAASRAALVAQANVALPAAATGGKPYFGKWRDVPAGTKPVPVVLFLHGSSGLGLKAIEDWQRWLADLGVASVAPDSFALPDHLTYKSPIGKDVYERIHTLRASEIDPTAEALAGAPWAAAGRIVLAGTSEGAVPVARHAGKGFAGRMIFSWSCEDNYFVTAHRTAVAPELPVLNVMSGTDVFFSPSNPWLGNPNARGHCGAVLGAHKNATVVLIPGAPHTLLNLPAARHATAGFVRDVLKP